MRNLAMALVATMVMITGCDDDDEGPIGDELPGDTFTIALTTAAEVPLCASAGLDATGAAVVTISDDETAIIVNDLSFSGLSSPTTAAHIHSGPFGAEGPIVFLIADAPRSPLGGIVFTAADYPVPVPAGAPVTFGGFVNEMQLGNAYINVHTTACPSGELRGQLQ